MPRIHASTKRAVPSPWVNPIRHGGHGARDRPEDGHEREHGGHERHDGPVFQADDGEADGAEHAVDRADDELSAYDACQTVIDAGQRASKPACPFSAHQRPKEADDSLAREHHVRRQHERDEEHEDDPADARDEVPHRARYLERVLLRVSERLSDNVGDGTVRVERFVPSLSRRLDQANPLFVSTTATPVPTSIARDPSGWGRATKALVGAGSGVLLAPAAPGRAPRHATAP